MRKQQRKTTTSKQRANKQQYIQMSDKKPTHPMADPNTCKDTKEVYDKCFYKWYDEKFLKGEITKDPCKPEFDEYQICIKVLPHSR